MGWLLASAAAQSWHKIGRGGVAGSGGVGRICVLGRLVGRGFSGWSLGCSFGWVVLGY